MRRIKTFPVMFHDGPHITITRRNYRLMRAVVRAADEIDCKYFNFPGLGKALAAFNAPEKRKLKNHDPYKGMCL